MSKPVKNQPSSSRSNPPKPAPSPQGVVSVTRASTNPPPASTTNRPQQAQTSASRPMARVEAKPGVDLPVKTASQPTREAIAEAAYFLWLRRGGNETVNWLEAEATLRGKVQIRV